MKKGYITYLKEAEKITEFLNVIGAHNSLLRFEDVRIPRDMRNSVNRLVNCETANLNKTIGASLRQVENIKLIDERIGLDALPEKLREIAQLRIDYQEVTLKELGEMVSSGKISKSGINHRLRKLDEIAEQLRSGQSVSLKNTGMLSQLAVIYTEMGFYQQSNELLDFILKNINEKMTECYYFKANNYAHLGLGGRCRNRRQRCLARRRTRCL